MKIAGAWNDQISISASRKVKRKEKGGKKKRLLHLFTHFPEKSPIFPLAMNKSILLQGIDANSKVQDYFEISKNPTYSLGLETGPILLATADFVLENKQEEKKTLQLVYILSSITLWSK